MTDIFVSYAREDRDRVAPLVEALLARGWTVWWDPTISYGSDYSDTIEKALQASRCVLVVWSHESVASYWVREEAAVGRGRGTLVPARIDDVQPPMGFRHLQTAELVGWDGEPTEASEKVVDDIGAMLGRLDTDQESHEAKDTVTRKSASEEPGSPAVPRSRRFVTVVSWSLGLMVAVLLAFMYSDPPASPPPAKEYGREEAAELLLAQELGQATKVAILDTTMDFALSSAFNLAMEDWGRFEIVLFPEDADVVMALSTRPDYTQMKVDRSDEEELEADDDLASRAIGTRRIIDTLYFKVFVQGGDDLWRDEVDVSESEESVQQLIDHLRERLEAAEDL